MIRARLVTKHRSTRNFQTFSLSLVSLCENFVIKDCTQNSQIALMTSDFALFAGELL